jgi:hypothetical protein
MRIHQFRPTTGISPSNAGERSGSTDAIGSTPVEEPLQEVKAPSQRALLEELDRAFGPRVADSVRRALELNVADPRLLSAGEIKAAMSVAETSRLVVSGFNFLPTAVLSAPVEFESCAKAAGVDPSTLSEQSKKEIYNLFALEMAIAGAANAQWVDRQAAELLMQKAIEKVAASTR